MKNLMSAALAGLLLAAGVSSFDVSAATAKAAAHYDCTKKGNANKAACKAAATTTPSTAPVTAPTKKPGLMGSLLHPSAKTATPAGTSPAPSAPAEPAKTMTTASAAPAGGHPVCKKGKPCGNSCIAQDKVCHK